MAGEYIITLHDRTLTVYPLETNGPNNLSVPRKINAVDVGTNSFLLLDDLTYRFVPGFQFNVISGANLGTFTVTVAGSSFNGTHTIIPVVEPVTDAIPYGNVQYQNPDVGTSLKFVGRGGVNYAEDLWTNIAYLLSNFAGDTPPTDPVTGQHWYNTTLGQEGFLYFDGTNWTSSFDVNNGSLIFNDPQNADSDIYLTGDESNLPASYTGTTEPGAVLWPEQVANNGDAIFRVLSQDGQERLRVEHQGSTVINNTLKIQPADGPLSATSSYLEFFNNNTSQGMIEVDATGTMYINNAGYSNDIIAANGGGNFGIGITPVAGFHVSKDTVIITAATQLTNTATNITYSSGGNFIIESTGGTLDLSGTNVNVTGPTIFNSPVGINNSPPSGTPVWLEVTGDIQANSQFRGSDQTSAAPTFTFTNHLDSGIFYSTVDNAVAIAANGTAALIVQSNQVEATGQLLSGQHTIQGQADEAQLVVKAASTQTANLQEWYNSANGLEASITFDGRYRGRSIRLTTDNPHVMFEETDATANNRNWLFKAINETLMFQALDDLGAGGGQVFTFERNGNQIETFNAVSGLNKWLTIDNVNNTLTLQGTTTFTGDSNTAPVLSIQQTFTAGGSTDSADIMFEDSATTLSNYTQTFVRRNINDFQIGFFDPNTTNTVPALNVQGDDTTGVSQNTLSAKETAVELDSTAYAASGTTIRLKTSSPGGVATTRFTIEANGTLTVGNTLGYETLITSDGNIPNKKYVDDAILNHNHDSTYINVTGDNMSGDLGMQGNKITQPELQNYSETTTIGNATGTVVLDLTLGNVFEQTLTGNTTFSFANPAPTGSTSSLTLILKQDATGGRTVTWPASVKWAGGTAPLLTTAANAVDILTFVTTTGGSVWYGFLSGADLK